MAASRLFKVFFFARRAQNLAHFSDSEFIEFYESKRVPRIRRLIEEEIQLPYLDWRRNYVPKSEPINLNAAPYLDYDVVFETTFPDREAYDAYVRASREIARQGLLDESQPFDLSSRRTLCVEERVGGIPLTAPTAEPYKLFMFARRRADLTNLTHEEFIDFYETKRVPLARRIVEQGMLEPYIDSRRNYVFRDDPLNLNLLPSMNFDIILSGTYLSLEVYEANMRSVRKSLKTTLYKDDSQPFDLSSRRYLCVEEYSGGVPLLTPTADRPS